MLSVATSGDTSVSQSALYQPASNNSSSSSGGGGTTTPAGSGEQCADQAQFEADKRAVYKHPLFPLLALLFERCELATQSSDPQSSDAFNMDIQAFVQHQERDRKPFLANEPEIDGLMIKAIQVLRIHLLELEKVQELCKDFCNRYITCLKGKMQSENLLRSDYAGGAVGVAAASGRMVGGGGGVLMAGGGGGGGATVENNNNSMLGHHSDSGSSESNSPVQYAISPSVASVAEQQFGGMQPQQQQQHPHYLQQQQQQAPSAIAIDMQHMHAQQLLGVGGAGGGGVVGGMVVHGSTPLGQIGVNLCVGAAAAAGGRVGGGAASITSDASGPLSPAPTTPDGSGDESDTQTRQTLDGATGGGGRKTKRGVLPKHATSVMRSWLFQHLVHPYPTEDEKRHIAAQTNLTLLQVNNWFINARRRILQPMLDASAPPTDGAPSIGGDPHSPPINKKRKLQHHHQQQQQHSRRAWPTHFGNTAQLDGGAVALLSSSDDDDDDEEEVEGDEEEEGEDVYSSDGSMPMMDAHAQQHENNGHVDDASL